MNQTNQSSQVRIEIMRVLFSLGSVFYLLWWSFLHISGGEFQCIYESMNVQLPFVSTFFIQLAELTNDLYPAFYLGISLWLIYSFRVILPNIDKLQAQSIEIQRTLINVLTLRLFFPLVLFLISFFSLFSPLLTLVNGAC